MLDVRDRITTRADVPASPRHHALGLDGLRGLAALIVVVYHIGLANHVALAPLGYLAVDFFFMLSGFVIALAYEPRLADGRLGWVAFAGLRARRLLPAAGLGVLLGIAVRLAGLVDDGALTAGALLGLLLLPDLAATLLYPLNNPLWSLFFELCANLAHPPVVRRLPTGLLLGLVPALGLAFVVYGRVYGQLNTGWGVSVIGGGFLRVAYGYLFGVLTCRLYRRVGAASPRLPGWLAPALVLLLAVPWAWQLGKVERVLVLTACPLALACGLGLSPPPGLKRLFVLLGHLSYPLYAVHMPLLQAAEPRLPALGAPGGPLAWGALFAVLVAVALAVERWWERPLLRRLARPAAPAQPAAARPASR